MKNKKSTGKRESEENQKPFKNCWKLPEDSKTIPPEALKHFEQIREKFGGSKKWLHLK